MTIPVILFIYMLLLVATVYTAHLFITATKEGGLFEWYDKKVLFPLRLKNSKFAKPMGECELCFTTWLGGIIGVAYIAGVLIYFGKFWWLLLTPSFMFLSIGLTAFFMMVLKPGK